MISGQLSISKVTLHLSCLLASACFVGSSAQAQFGLGLNRVGVVGGVSVDADGAVRRASRQESDGWLKNLRQSVQQPAEAIAQGGELRMVSLSKLQREIQRAIETNTLLSDEVLYLAGLQRIEYVFVYPELNDIVLAGPAEGWVVREDATVVGSHSGRPVLQLEDLLTAFRTVDAARQQAITVSIDPTPEGELRLNRLLSQVKLGPGVNLAALEQSMCKAFGPQTVKLTTVAEDSRMAQTLVAADYRMKRLAMNLEESPVLGLPSYMEMIRNQNSAGVAQPRWWMACEYEALLHSDDMLAWRLTGQGIKAMTEDELVSVTGARTGTGRANPLAQKWADLFTAKFEELCVHNAAFGDLRNAMDLSIVATVIRAHELEQVAGCDFGLLRGDGGALKTPTWQTPKTISPECSLIRGTAGVTVSASGGVEINPWKIVAETSREDKQVKAVQQQAAASRADHWWWNS